MTSYLEIFQFYNEFNSWFGCSALPKCLKLSSPNSIFENVVKVICNRNPKRPRNSAILALFIWTGLLIKGLFYIGKLTNQ